MAYNPYSAISEIYKEKGNWDSAKKAGNTTAKNTAAQNAQKYYNELISNGYQDVADALKGSDYTEAKAIKDKWAKMGKTSTRDYMYSLGQSKGMTQADVDNLIGWDNQTKEVSFGGKKIGTPDAVVDGTSYWSDTSALDNAFNDYVSRSGTTVADTQLMGQHNTEIKDKINQLWGTQNSDRQMMTDKYGRLEDTAYSNPFDTDEAKAILAKYDLEALQGRDNAVASGGASNGGNIDSYAAANALRQQASLTAKGQSMVLDAHTNKINNVKGILSDLGVYLQNQDKGMQTTIGIQQDESQRLFDNNETKEQRLFDNDQTAKNNEVARLSEEASVTGYTPTEWTIKNNATFSNFLNSDGSFKKEMDNVDIQALISDAKAKGDTKLANDLAVVRAAKIYSNLDKYGKYLNQGDIASMTHQQTEAGRQADLNSADTRYVTDSGSNDTKYTTDAQERMNTSNNDTSVKIAGIESDTTKYGYDKQLEGDKYTTDASERMNTANNATSEKIAGIESDTTKYGYDKQVEVDESKKDDVGDNFDDDEGTEWTDFYDSFSEKESVQTFLTDVVKGIYNKAGTGQYNADVLEDELIEAIKNNTAQYDIDVADARRICNKFGVDTSWLADYKDYARMNTKEGMYKAK